MNIYYPQTSDLAMKAPLVSHQFLTRLVLSFIAFVSVFVANLNAEIIKQPHVRAELLSEYQSAHKGETLLLGLHLKPDPGWHVYWQYAGDFGSSPVLSWSINGDPVQGTLLWPVPKKIETGPYTNFGYENEVLLLAELPLHLDLDESFTVTLDAEWLACKEECIPGFATFDLKLPLVDENTKLSPSDSFALFKQFKNRLPLAQTDLGLEIKDENDSQLSILLSGIPADTKSLWFMPAVPGIIDIGKKQEFRSVLNNFKLILPKPTNFSPTSKSVYGLLFKSPPWAKDMPAREATFTLKNTTLESSVTTTDAKQSTRKTKNSSLFLVILAAFLGGLILNLMPCVFPVLSIKILQFVNKSGKDPGAIKIHGLSFAAGILVSFWILLAILRIFISTGQKLGWGFQLQNPYFVAILILLLFAIALNLFGLFEFGASLQTFFGRKKEKTDEGYFGSFSSGVLATVLATPCTAPFMGTAIAYALSSNIAVSFIVFSALGLGLATPYVLLTFYPKALKVLPRPGAWMETFKQLMAFPILLTALWLFWVFEQQTGEFATILLLLSCTVLTFALWIFALSSSPQSTKTKRRLGTILSLLCIGFALVIARHSATITPVVLTADSDSGEKFYLDQYQQKWLPFSEELIEKLEGESRPYYIDFTASWCVTCQLNKKVVFASQEVRDTIVDKKIVLVRGDWTRQDPVITTALKKYGRAGVPLNVLFIPGETEPVIFPALLSPSIVLEEFQKVK